MEEMKKSQARDDVFLKTFAEVSFRSAKTVADMYAERMQKDNDLYDGKFSANEKKWSEFLGAPRLFIPKIYSYVQRILVDVMEAFFSDPDDIVDVTNDKNLPEEKRQIVKSVLNYRLNSHPINFYQEAYEAALDALKTKYCVLYVYPKLKTEKEAQSYEFPDVVGGVQVGMIRHEVEEEKITAYEPCFEALPPEDVMFSANATWKDYHQHTIIYRYRKTRDELDRLGYKNVSVPSAVTSISINDPVKIQRTEGTQSPFSPETVVKQQEEVLCYAIWTHFPGDDGFLESGHYVMLGDESGPQVVGKEWEPNRLPYKFSEFEYNRPPFILGNAYPEPHELAGKSFPEVNEALQGETNAQRNQEREAVARALRPQVFISRDANPDLMSLVNRRIGGYTLVDGQPQGAAYEMQSVNPSMITAQHQQRTDNDFFETSGIPPNLMGYSQREETATAVTQQLGNANKKISQVIKNLAYTAFLPAFTYLLRLEQTYGSDEFVSMVTGKMLGIGFAADGNPPMTMIQGDFDLRVTLGMNKQLQLNKIFLLMDRANQSNQATAQLIQLGVVDPSKVKFWDTSKFQEAALPLLGFKNVSDWQLEAVPPPMPAEAAGIASQPANVQDPTAQVSNMNPEAMLNVL